MASLPDEQRQPLNDLLAEIESLRPQVQAQMGMVTLISFLYTYQTLSQEELQAYLDFATSPAGTRYHQAGGKGIKAALLDGTLALGKTLIRLSEQPKTQNRL